MSLDFLKKTGRARKKKYPIDHAGQTNSKMIREKATILYISVERRNNDK